MSVTPAEKTAPMQLQTHLEDRGISEHHLVELVPKQVVCETVLTYSALCILLNTF